MTDWQPIATAPKDGAHILVHDPTEEVSVVAYWKPCLLDGGDRGDWVMVAADDAGWLMLPTHWQPIPPPPVKTDQTQAKVRLVMRQVCLHPADKITAGPRIPRVYGTGPTVRCDACGAWRTAWGGASGPWRPADTLPEALEPDENR